MMITINRNILKYILYIQSKDAESFVKQAFLISFDSHCNGKNNFHSHLMNMSAVNTLRFLHLTSDLLDIAMVKSYLRADVSKYRPEVYKTEKSKILKKIHKVALGKLLT